jgi:hypothetical protein
MGHRRGVALSGPSRVLVWDRVLIAFEDHEF